LDALEEIKRSLRNNTVDCMSSSNENIEAHQQRLLSRPSSALSARSTISAAGTSFAVDIVEQVAASATTKHLTRDTDLQSSSSIGSKQEYSHDSEDEFDMLRKTVPAGRGRKRYRKDKLRTWFFNSINAGSKEDGNVIFREFLTALRKFPQLQQALCEAGDVHFGPEDQLQHAKLAREGLLALPVQERCEALHKERMRVKELFERICGDSSGGTTMQWPTFYKFFLRRGLVV